MPFDPPMSQDAGASSVPRLMASPRRSVTILGVAIDDLSVDEAVSGLRAAAVGRQPRTIYFANAHTLNGAVEADGDRRILNQADLVFGDGTGVRWAARLQRHRMRANLNGTDLIPLFLQAAAKNGLRVYLLGARSAVVARAAEVISRRYPGSTVVGYRDGYFPEDANEEVVAGINEAAPHVLLVAMGNPLQERWIHANRAGLRVNLCVGVGGLLAYMSGDVPRAPSWMRRLGLEWLGVMAMQPRKTTRYLRGIPLFLWRVVRERLVADRRAP